MYAEAEFKFDWSNALKKLIVLATTTLLILLIFYLFNNNKEQNTYFEDNLITMTNVAKNYFNNHEYTNNKITLEEMINKKMLIDFVDENGNNCNTKKSYAQINNNKIKISLTCDIEQKTTEITI